jgi:citrate synthase
LWQGRLPTATEREGIRADLGRARAEAFERLPRLGDALSAEDGMDALRAALGHLPSGLPSSSAGLSSPSAAAPADAARLTGAVAVFAAAFARVKAGQPPLAPDPAQSHAADYLRMACGEAAKTAPGFADRAAGMDAYLVTVTDHGMNASTFTARVVASTGSDLVSAVVAAVGALKGPLHGGAPGPVLDMLDEIEKPERAQSFLEAELSAGRRIMGMGHRIYRVRDPRAAVLERAIERLEKSGVSSGRLSLARAVERAAVGVLLARHPDRPLHANVEFYTSVLLDTLGLPRTLFSPTFAVGRVAGWCAHVEEQRRTGRLIRPASRYVGPLPAAQDQP